MIMKAFRFYTIGIAIVVTSVTACRNQDPVVRDDRTYDTTGSRSADSTAPGIHSDTLVAGANDWILVPGEAAGHTHIGDDLAKLSRELGRPDAGDAAMQKSVSVWFTNHDTTNNSVAVYASRDAGNDDVARIRQIRITAPRFETVRGIRVGTSERDIRAHYTVKDVEQYRSKDGTQSKVLDSEEGIAFEIGADGICDAIVIHPAGAERYGTYLKLRY